MQGRRMIRLAAFLLGLWGFYQLVAGLYFIFLRPSFLQEDLRAASTALGTVRSAAPGIEAWLQWVFAVLGGQMAAVGVLVMGGATSIAKGRRPRRTEVAGYTIAGVFSVVVMSVVNFELVSDFRWLLVMPVAIWCAAIIFLLRLPT